MENAYQRAVNVLVRQELNAGRSLRLVISSLSMLPLLKPRDEIIARKQPLAALRPGDIIIFEKEQQPCCHRLLGRKISARKIYLLTKGDNSRIADQPVPVDKFLAKVTSIIRARGDINLENRGWRLLNRMIWGRSCLEWKISHAWRKFKRALLSYHSA